MRLIEDQTLSCATARYVVLNWFVTVVVGFSCSLGLPHAAITQNSSLREAASRVLSGGELTAASVLVIAFALLSFCIHGLLLEDDVEEGGDFCVERQQRRPAMRKASFVWLLEVIRCVFGVAIYTTLSNNALPTRDEDGALLAQSQLTQSWVPIAPEAYVSTSLFWAMLIPCVVCLPIAAAKIALKVLGK